MKSKQMFFFAEAYDLMPIFEKIELNEPIHYFQAGTFDSNCINEFKSIFEVSKFGYVLNGDWNHIDFFLLMPKMENIAIREIPQKNGGIRYAIDQMQNCKSVVVKIGGIYRDDILVAGSIGTISNDAFSLKMFKMISSELKRNFVKIDDFYVGERAVNKLKNGWRLVTNYKSPMEYNLKIR